MSQNQQVLQSLRRGPITAADAVGFGCYRLAARVKNLREEGYDIHTELVVNKDGKRFARYTLRGSTQAA